MRLKKYLLRYYPPAICLEYTKSSGATDVREIPLPHLNPDTNITALVNQLVAAEPLLSSSRKQKLRRLLEILVAKQLEGRDALHSRFTCKKVIKPHQLPMTNFAITKKGDRIATASYDKTCKISESALQTTEMGSTDSAILLAGHQGPVYTVAFNNYSGSRVATGSFDKTCKLWKTKTGELLRTFVGHTGEVVCLAFTDDNERLTSGGMDGTLRLWDATSGTEICRCDHSSEVRVNHVPTVANASPNCGTGCLFGAQPIQSRHSCERLFRLQGKPPLG
jgi:dynein assembly factor with WDR repeat domains 1